MYWVPKHLYAANSLKSKMPLRVQAGKSHRGLFCLVEPVFSIMVWDICPGWWVALRQLRTLSPGNWAHHFIWIWWVTEDTGLCQPACRRTSPFWKKTVFWNSTPRCMVLQSQHNRLSQIRPDSKAIRWVWRLRHTLLLFYTGFNQAVLKGNFWISLFVQSSWMWHLVRVLSNLKADLSHRSWLLEWMTGKISGQSHVLLGVC